MCSALCSEGGKPYLLNMNCLSEKIYPQYSTELNKENIIFVCLCSGIRTGQRIYFKVYCVKKIIITFFY